jgi:hypothetical protein
MSIPDFVVGTWRNRWKRKRDRNSGLLEEGYEAIELLVDEGKKEKGNMNPPLEKRLDKW